MEATKKNVIVIWERCISEEEQRRVQLKAGLEVAQCE